MKSFEQVLLQSIGQYEVLPHNEDQILDIVKQYLSIHCDPKTQVKFQDRSSSEDHQDAHEAIVTAVTALSDGTISPPSSRAPGPSAMRPKSATVQRAYHAPPLNQIIEEMNVDFGAPTFMDTDQHNTPKGVQKAMVPRPPPIVAMPMEPLSPPKYSPREPLVDRLTDPDHYTGVCSQKDRGPPKDPYATRYRFEGDPRSNVPLGQMWGDATIPTNGGIKQAIQPGVPIEHQVFRMNLRRPRTGPITRTGVFERLTDHTQYTGSHIHRFGADGKGRGGEGRDLGKLGRGMHANTLDGSQKLRPQMSYGTTLRTQGKTTYVPRNQNHVL